MVFCMFWCHFPYHFTWQRHARPPWCSGVDKFSGIVLGLLDQVFGRTQRCFILFSSLSFSAFHNKTFGYYFLCLTVAQALQVNRYPSIGLCINKGNQMTLVGRLQGYHSAAELVDRLNQLFSNNQRHLSSARQERYEFLDEGEKLFEISKGFGMILLERALFTCENHPWRITEILLTKMKSHRNSFDQFA